MRQTGDDQIRFRQLLENVANGSVTEEDYHLLQSRFAVNNMHEKSKFDRSLRLISKKKWYKSFQRRLTSKT